MTMVTQCTHCGTLFRVTPQQLQKRHGRVRCGRCREIFDGFQALSAEPERVRVEHVGAPPSPEPQDIVDTETIAPAHARDAEALREPPRSQLHEQQDEAARELEDRAPESIAARASLWPDQDDTQIVRRPRAVAAFAAGSIVLVMVLLAQAVYAYRVDLAAHFAGLRPFMRSWCAAAGCTVPLPQRPRLIGIEASDLQAIDPQRPGLIKLTATLRSHASYDLAYPALDLVLTNAQDHALARRIFLPQEYLDAKRDVDSGLPPSAEVTVQLELDAAELGAAGFRLDLLPAPG